MSAQGLGILFREPRAYGSDRTMMCCPCALKSRGRMSKILFNLSEIPIFTDVLYGLRLAWSTSSDTVEVLPSGITELRPLTCISFATASSLFWKIRIGSTGHGCPTVDDISGYHSTKVSQTVCI
eukprot:scaffold7395_cov175-Amphora_coffeaeformis.AAC.12